MNERETNCIDLIQFKSYSKHLRILKEHTNPQRMNELLEIRFWLNIWQCEFSEMDLVGNVLAIGILLKDILWTAEKLG